MVRSLVWVIANVGIAVAIVFAGFIVIVVAEPTDPGNHLADVGWSGFFALWLLPWYLPTVLLSCVLLAVLARWIPARAAALLAAPVAPGYLWIFVIDSWFDPLFAGVAVGGAAAYGASVRLPRDRPLRDVLLASAIELAPVFLFTGSALLVIVVLVAALAWGFHRQLRTPAVAR